MKDRDDTPVFLSAEQLPLVSHKVPVVKVFRSIGARGNGSFVVHFPDEKRFLVKGQEFASTLFLPNNEGMNRDLLIAPIGEAIHYENFAGYRVPVFPSPLEDGNPQRYWESNSSYIYEATRNGLRVGWYIPHWIADAAIRRPVFKCENGHTTHEADNGYCDQCPGKLIK